MVFMSSLLSLGVVNSSANQYYTQIMFTTTAINHRGSFVNISDDRTKSYAVPVENATSVLERLYPKTYRKHPSLITNDEAPDLTGVAWRTESGLIAQDVEKIAELAHIVGEMDKDSTTPLKGIAYQDLIAWLIKGFQEQKARIDELEHKLDVVMSGQ